MVKKLDGVLLSSADTKKLADFYKDVVGLDCTNEWEMGEDGETAYEFADVQMFINPHSEVHGKSKEPARYMLNFEVNNIEKDFAHIKKEGAKVIQDIYHIENYGLIATFEDPDGNYFQLVQIRPTES